MSVLLQALVALIGFAVAAYLLLFAHAGWREGRRRVVVMSIAAIWVWNVLWFGTYRLMGESDVAAIILVSVVIIAAALFFGRIGSHRKMKIEGEGERVDERDTVFAREGYLEGTDKHAEYYRARPELLEIDTRIRSKPELLKPGGRYYDPVRSRATDAVFDQIVELGTRVDGEVLGSPGESDPERNRRRVKQRTFDLGALEVGIAKLDQRWVYSHVGRGPEPWGKEIKNDHRYAIVFAVEMDYAKVDEAPGIGITEETAKRYHQGAEISIQVAAELRSQGHSARAHIAGSNYQVILPALAHAAGLGEMGRMGYFISRRHGARIRLGAVTTSMPLVPDEAVSFGVQDFCDRCKKCVDNCPSGAIPRGMPEMIRGVEKWPLNAERCILYWRAIGTDCGLCMKVCPYSHPMTFVHRVVHSAVTSFLFSESGCGLGR